jgi:NAD(P)-dependent dehydrogenase (short-subunit alcohol dehydrogenase family)
MFYLLYEQKAYPLLKEAGSARMVLISSVAGGPTAMKSGTLYAMTKGKRPQSSSVSLI